jgi:hypothetical protein
MIRATLEHVFASFCKYPLSFQNALWYQITLEKVKDQELSGNSCSMNLMRLQTRRLFSISLGLVLVLIQGSTGQSANAPPQGTPGVFFSQGQAIYSSQNRLKSQQAAIQDFLVQAIVQAAATFLSPGQLGEHYQVIQERLLKQPDRYVQSYELFTENPDQAGLYRITGQVTVSMDLLKKDLMTLGLTRTEAEGSQPQVFPSGPQAAPSRPSIAQPDKKGGLPDNGTVSAEEVLWAVAEKWDDEWQLPGDSKGSEGLLAASVFQASRDYGWSIRLPQMGTLAPDGNGEVPSAQALALAEALGLHRVVVGNVGLMPGQDDEVRLQAKLYILSVASGKAQGEIHKELAIRDMSAQEAALELADFVVPQLERQLRGAAQTGPATDSVAVPEETGELVLQIRSRDGYTDWLALEKTLREHFKELQVKGFEIRPEMSIVKILGADGTSLMNLDGTRLSNGLQIQITRLGRGHDSLTITFVKPGISPVEPRR